MLLIVQYLETLPNISSERLTGVAGERRMKILSYIGVVPECTMQKKA
jgi:hypothetical protein